MGIKYRDISSRKMYLSKRASEITAIEPVIRRIISEGGAISDFLKESLQFLKLDNILEAMKTLRLGEEEAFKVLKAYDEATGGLSSQQLEAVKNYSEPIYNKIINFDIPEQPKFDGSGGLLEPASKGAGEVPVPAQNIKSLAEESMRGDIESIIREIKLNISEDPKYFIDSFRRSNEEYQGNIYSLWRQYSGTNKDLLPFALEEWIKKNPYEVLMIYREEQTYRNIIDSIWSATPKTDREVMAQTLRNDQRLLEQGVPKEISSRQPTPDVIEGGLEEGVKVEPTSPSIPKKDEDIFGDIIDYLNRQDEPSKVTNTERAIKDSPVAETPSKPNVPPEQSATTKEVEPTKNTDGTNTQETSTPGKGEPAKTPATPEEVPNNPNSASPKEQASNPARSRAENTTQQISEQSSTATSPSPKPSGPPNAETNGSSGVQTEQTGNPIQTQTPNPSPPTPLNSPNNIVTPAAQEALPPNITRTQVEEAGNAIARNPKSFISRLKNSGKIGLAARVATGVTAGLVGLALINYIFSKDEESFEDITGSNGTPPQGSSNLGYESTSLILKAKGYLSSVQTSWTKEFDSAFREFIDAGSLARGTVITNLVGGQEWKNVAVSLGFTPDKQGAFAAVRAFDEVVPKKQSSGKKDISFDSPFSGLNKKTPEEKIGVLGDIVGAMNNKKLVGTPGFDLIREPKRIEALVNAVGGANPTGYQNAARVISARNPNILSKIPDVLTGPVDSAFAKNPENKSLLQDVQVAINAIYEDAVSGSKTLGVFNPRLEKSTELVKNFLNSPAGGNWTEKTSSNYSNQWVKLANQRKQKLKAEILKEMSPLEKAAARKLKMREATNE